MSIDPAAILALLSSLTQQVAQLQQEIVELRAALSAPHGQQEETP